MRIINGNKILFNLLEKQFLIFIMQDMDPLLLMNLQKIIIVLIMKIMTFLIIFLENNKKIFIIIIII